MIDANIVKKDQMYARKNVRLEKKNLPANNASVIVQLETQYFRSDLNILLYFIMVVKIVQNGSNIL